MPELQKMNCLNSSDQTIILCRKIKNNDICILYALVDDNKRNTAGDY